MDDLQISAKEVNERIARGEKLLLVDVREHWEYDLCKIPGAKLIPLGTIPANLNTLLDVDDEVICYCHHGMRSLDAAHWLRVDGMVRELYDVAVLPQVARPMVLGFKTDEIQRIIAVGEDGRLS